MSAGLVSATAGADIVMQTATQRKVDLASAFAEILGASCASAGQPSGASTSTVGALSEKPNATVSSSTVLEGDKKPGKPHQAADFPAPTFSDSAVTLHPEIPVLMNGFAVPLGATPAPAATDVSATASVAISSDDASNDAAQLRQAPGRQPQGAAKAEVSNWPLTLATAQPWEATSSNLFGISTMQSSAGLVSSAMPLMGGPSSSEPPAGILVQETGTTTITIAANESVQNSSDMGALTRTAAAMPSITLPGKTGAQNSTVTVTPSNTSKSSAWNGAHPAIAAASNESPASTSSRSFTAKESAAATEQKLRAGTASSGPLAPPSTSAEPTIEATSRAMDALTPEGVADSSSSRTMLLAPAHEQQPSQHASPEITTGTIASRDRVPESDLTASSFESERPIIQLEAPKNSQMTFVSGLPPVLQSRPDAGTRPSEPGEPLHGSQANPTDQVVSPSPSESTAISSAFQPMASGVSIASTLPTPGAAWRAPTSAPFANRISSVKVVSVSAAESVVGANRGDQLTQGANADPNTLASKPTIPIAAGTQQLSASKKSETAPLTPLAVQFNTPQSAQAGPAKIEVPNTDNSTHPASTGKWPRAAVPAVPSISDSTVSLPQARQSTPHAPTQMTIFHLEEPQPANSSSDAKIEVSHQTDSSAPQAAPNSHLTPGGSSKMPAADSSRTPLIPVTATEDADSPSMEQGTDTVILHTAYPTTATPSAYDSESSLSTWPGVGTSAAFTSGSGAQDLQTQTNTRSSRSQNVAANASTEPLAATPDTSDAPASTQALSAATSASKVDSPGSATSGAPAKSPSASNDLGTSSEVFAQRPAENVELSSGLQAWNGGDNAQTRLIQSANLGGNLRSSEMNIALHAESLGPVELRTRITGDVVGASIGVERHDAHAMIASELPALHQALNDRQLRVGELSVFQGSVHSGGATGDGRPSQQRETAQQSSATTTWAAEENSTLPEIAVLSESGDSGTLFDSNGRLSVRA